MTDQEIKCFEDIAVFLYNKGKSYIQDGNTCDEVLDVLWTIEEFVLSERQVTMITALCEDLQQHNTECQDFSR